MKEKTEITLQLFTLKDLFLVLKEYCSFRILLKTKWFTKNSKIILVVVKLESVKF